MDIRVLLVVDTIGCLSSKSLKDNAYFFDNEKYIGSWKEGCCDLHTLTEYGQNIIWNVQSVSLENEVKIVGFEGEMINQAICIPKEYLGYEDGVWKGRVSGSQPGRYNYNIILSIEGKQFSLTPYLELQ